MGLISQKCKLFSEKDVLSSMKKIKPNKVCKITDYWSYCKIKIGLFENYLNGIICKLGASYDATLIMITRSKQYQLICQNESETKKNTIYLYNVFKMFRKGSTVTSI